MLKQVSYQLFQKTLSVFLFLLDNLSRPFLHLYSLKSVTWQVTVSELCTWSTGRNDDSCRTTTANKGAPWLSASKQVNIHVITQPVGVNTVSSCLFKSVLQDMTFTIRNIKYITWHQSIKRHWCHLNKDLEELCKKKYTPREYIDQEMKLKW